MSTASTQFTVRGIEIDVVYKDIKHLHIGVYPPIGRVRIAAPKGFDEDRVRLAVVQRIPWIRRQRKALLSATRQSEREMVAGETHYVWGRQKRLKVVERPGKPHIEMDGMRLTLFTSPDVTSTERRAVLDRWYRRELRTALSHLIPKWESALSVEVPMWSVRKMKTKWGSCNRKTQSLWFNVELAKKDPTYLEYIVVHELTHYDEVRHGARFELLMDERLPDWRVRRDALNCAPLAEEKW